jgi:hypothetical protein
MANREGHRRFGNVRKRDSGRYQIRYPGPDGRIRTGTETYARKSDAERALVLIEAQIASGEWTDPDRGKVKLADYAAAWITQRPKLRPRTIDLYRSCSRSTSRRTWVPCQPAKSPPRWSASGAPSFSPTASLSRWQPRLTGSCALFS